MQVAHLDNYFHSVRRFVTLALALELDSLVRVSRRDRETRTSWGNITTTRVVNVKTNAIRGVTHMSAML